MLTGEFTKRRGVVTQPGCKAKIVLCIISRNQNNVAEIKTTSQKSKLFIHDTN